MNKPYRIKKNSEIDAIIKQRKVKGNPCFSIYQHEDSTQPRFRFALSVGRKYGRAVERNRIKRRLRMLVAEQKDNIGPSQQFIIVIKPAAKDLSYQDMRKQVIELMVKSKILENKHA
ncbi:MAG: ribonuclease P protein component [Acholeplasmataceae bacterium]|nr:MAG: ribonuclease P protein component [Acholeplasmataceae bacterium]